MEPQIQYAKTKDGASIAYYTMGTGEPLVELSAAVWSHTELERRLPHRFLFLERLAQERTVVRFDSRGCGLSDRDVADYSVDTFRLGLEAVVNHLGLDRFALMGTAYSGPLAIDYAVTPPDNRP